MLSFIFSRTGATGLGYATAGVGNLLIAVFLFYLWYQEGNLGKKDLKTTLKFTIATYHFVDFVNYLILTFVLLGHVAGVNETWQYQYMLHLRLWFMAPMLFASFLVFNSIIPFRLLLHEIFKGLAEKLNV